MSESGEGWSGVPSIQAKKTGTTAWEPRVVPVEEVPKYALAEQNRIEQGDDLLAVEASQARRHVKPQAR